MHPRRTTFTALIAAATIGLTLVITAQGTETFKVRLATVPIDFVEAPSVTGSGSATAALNGDTLTITGTFEGLRGPATIAQLRRGRAKGIRGPVIADLTVAKAQAGAISGTAKLTAAQIEALKSGALYIQIDSETAKTGNLWGFLLK